MIVVVIGLQVLTLALLCYAIFTAKQEEPDILTTDDDVKGMV